MYQFTSLALIAAACLIWSNVQAADGMARLPSTAKETEAAAAGKDIPQKAGMKRAKAGRKAGQDTIVAIGQRPGIRSEDMKRSSRRNVRQDMINFKFKLPRLRLGGTGK